MTVPYLANEIEVTAVAEDAAAVVTGIGKHSLNVGLNIIAVKVTSTDNIERTYQIKVTREKSNEARLSSLSVKEHTLTPTFDMNEKTYYIETNKSKLEIDATTFDPDASYEIMGNNELANGVNSVIIRVTAPDGVTICDYNLIVTKTVSYNNNLADLWVDGYEIKPEFNKSTQVYKVTVPYDVNKVGIGAKAEEEKATIIGTGVVTLSQGENTFRSYGDFRSRDNKNIHNNNKQSRF